MFLRCLIDTVTNSRKWHPSLEEFREAPLVTVHSPHFSELKSQITEKQTGKIAKTTQTAFKRKKKKKTISKMSIFSSHQKDLKFHMLKMSNESYDLFYYLQ